MELFPHIEKATNTIGKKIFYALDTYEEGMKSGLQ